MAAKLIARQINPPVPSRRFDWQAVEEGYDLGDPVGYGATEKEALDDLREILGLDANNEPDPIARAEKGKDGGRV